MKGRSGAILVAGLGLVLASCGGNGNATPSTSSTANAATNAAALRVAVRRALQQNYALSLFVLGHNRVPTWAVQSTRGPALAGLRSSAAGRAKRGIEIHVLDRKFAIVSLRLDASYLRANATVRTTQHVRPYRGGSPIGKAINLNERAQIELHRLGTAAHFVVWKVVLLK